MRNLHYAGELLTVDTDICSAIFEYAKVLANAGVSDVIQVPVLIDGRREFSNVLLGPSSALFCTPAEDSGIDLAENALLEELAQKTEALRPMRGSAVTSFPPDNRYTFDHDGF
jgi:hypothetical protein